MKSNIIRLHWLAIVLSAAYSSLTSAAPSATSAYTTDAQSSFVADQTSEGINQVNSIMCYIGAMAPSAMVNNGNYIALIDETKCDTGGRDKASNSGSSSSGSTASQYSTATVNSSRASNSDPMIGKVWVDENNEGQQMTIFVHAAATAAPTTTNPYGTFRMDFCGKPNSNLNGACFFNGFIDASSTGLSFFQNEPQGGGGGGGIRTTALTLNANGTTSGSGAMALVDPFMGSTNFAFAYNANYFLRNDGTGAQCFSRDATDPDTGFSVWRYGLYDATTGDRITRNSGFPIEYTSGGTTQHGYVGYYGLWLPQDVLNTIATGAMVQKVSYGSGSATTADYTLVKTGGKLTKYTKGTKTLAEIDQIRFTFFANSGVAPGTFTAPDAYAQFSSYEMYWDNTNTRFVITGKQTCGSNGCQLANLTAPVTVTSNAYWSTNYPFGISGWSQSLGGQVSIATSSLSATSVVTYRTQDIVYPSQYTAIGALKCIADCPTASGITAFLATTAPTPFGSTANNYGSTPVANLVSYTLDTASGHLIDGALQQVVTPSALTGQYQGGIRSGRLFAASDAVAVDAADGAADTSFNQGGVDSLATYYVWETGPNSWNQFSAVKDVNGAYVQFDAPLNVNYTVPSNVSGGPNYGSYAGKTIVLQYGGFGDLWGVPGKCVDPKTNALVTDCSTAGARYVPEFAIPFSQTTGVATSGSTNYLVKWLDREIRFAKKTTECGTAGLTLPTGVTLPTSAGLKDPSLSTSEVYIGAKPTVTSAPRVIQGIVQY
jgi:hypothetical protein